MVESFFGRQQTQINRRPYALSAKRNHRLPVRLSPVVSRRAPWPEGDPAVCGEGQDVDVEESVLCRAEKTSTPALTRPQEASPCLTANCMA